MSAGSLTLGGNLSVAVGPLGRNAEGSGAVSSKGKVAAMYSYSKTKGLFGGVSVEGSVIVERQDANRLAYGGDSLSVKQILSGQFDPPDWADILIHELERCAGGGHTATNWKTQDDWKTQADEGEDSPWGRSGRESPLQPPSKKNRDRSGSGASQGSGYLFGESSGAAGGSTPPRKPAASRSRASSLLGPLPGAGGDDKGRGSPRPSVNKRSSSFNPFSSNGKGNPDKILPSSETYNAGMTWDSDGPAGTNSTGYDGARARSGSNPLRGGFTRSDSNRGADLLRDWDEGEEESPWKNGLGGDKKPKSSQGGNDLLGKWTAGDKGITPSFASAGNLNTNSYSSTRSPNRSRSGSKSQPIRDIPEDEYVPFETVSRFAQMKLNGSNGRSQNRFDERPMEEVSPFGADVQERRPFDDYQPKSHGRNVSSSSFGRGQGESPRRDRSDNSRYGQFDGSDSQDRQSGRFDRDTPKPNLQLRHGLSDSEVADTGFARAVALFDFAKAQSGDLGFKKGQVVVVMDKVGESGEWWKGHLTEGNSGVGIFPSNYVEVLHLPKSDELKGGVRWSELKARMASLPFD